MMRGNRCVHCFINYIFKHKYRADNSVLSVSIWEDFSTSQLVFFQDPYKAS